MIFPMTTVNCISRPVNFPGKLHPTYLQQSISIKISTSTALSALKNISMQGFVYIVFLGNMRYFVV